MSMLGALQQPSSLLAKRVVFHSHDLDETRYHIGELFVPHTLKVIGKHQKIDADIRHASYDPFTFAYIRHGANVDINPGKLKDFFMIQIPLKGTAEVQVDGKNVNCSQDMAVMLSPTLNTTMRFRKSTEHLNIRINKGVMEAYLEQQLRRCLSHPLEFIPDVALKSERAIELLNFVSFIAWHLNDPDSVYQHPVIRNQLAEVLLNMFLLNLGHNYHEELSQATRALQPAYVKQALTFMHENASEAISPQTIATAVNTSSRSLYAGFKKYLDTTPMAHLKSIRLNKVRETLQTANPQEKSVSEIALEYGFTHLGHFSENYRNRFGELPSQTLNKQSRAGAK